MTTFQLKADYSPTGDQPEAIARLTDNVLRGVPEQVLLGVTGSGKTFTMANVIANTGRPALIISHNKTLAAQLYQEFRDFFPTHAVSYFVSYYDYYQPEAYIPQTDTYIEKETEINEEIDKLRLAATTNLLTRPDTIVIASVSCIYNIGSPKEYGHFVLELKVGSAIGRKQIFDRLTQLQYDRSDIGFHRGTFRVRGEVIDVFPAYADTALRIVVTEDTIRQLQILDPLTGKITKDLSATYIYPAKHYMTDPQTYKPVFERIRADLEREVTAHKNKGRLIEAQRLEQRVNFDLEMIAEMGYVNGIENYSRYFDGRKPGDAPYSLFDYFYEATSGRSFSDPAAKKDWLLFVDESHMSIPQVRGMYHGDRSRKQTLIDYGFRLQAAIDNRPLTLDEFMRRMPQTIYVSATPADWELSRIAGTNTKPVEQLIRPTGLVDPEVSIRPISGQIEDLTSEIERRTRVGERALVTTLTKRMAEDLATFLADRGIKVHYLHSDVLTLERSDILAQLRGGTYDVVVGINLLREGLDLPEVSLVAILDADKEGFLRSRTSLVQTMGRAARHVHGQVILYADVVTASMEAAIAEVTRRRRVQLTYNKKRHITPLSINKPIRQALVDEQARAQKEHQNAPLGLDIELDQLEAMTPQDKKKYIADLTQQMRRASQDLNFERAAQLRDAIKELQAGV